MTQLFLATCCTCGQRQFVEPRGVDHARQPHCFKCGGPLEFTTDSLRRLGSINRGLAPNDSTDWADLYDWFRNTVGADWKPPENDEELGTVVIDLADQTLCEAIYYLAYGDVAHVSPLAIVRLVELKIAEVGDNGSPNLTAYGEKCFQILESGGDVPGVD